MALVLEYLVRTLIFLLVAITPCTANIRSVMTKFTEKKSVATSHTTIQNISKVRCVEKCNKERQNDRCTLAGYNKATKTCYLSVDDPLDAMDTTDEMSGVFFFEPESTGVTCAADGEPLLNGTNPVPDSYFTASSAEASFPAHGARSLDGTDSYWCPAKSDRTANPRTMFLQIQFHVLSTVVRVATQGGNGAYVSQYRLAYSQDCVTFNNILDVAGNIITFTANTDATTVVENQLAFPVSARCFRLHPLTFTGWGDLSIEVYGCPSV